MKTIPTFWRKITFCLSDFRLKTWEKCDQSCVESSQASEEKIRIFQTRLVFWDDFENFDYFFILTFWGKITFCPRDFFLKTWEKWDESCVESSQASEKKLDFFKLNFFWGDFENFEIFFGGRGLSSHHLDKSSRIWKKSMKIFFDLCSMVIILEKSRSPVLNYSQIYSTLKVEKTWYPSQGQNFKAPYLAI